MTKNADKPAYPSGEAYKSQSIPGGNWVECKKGALHNGLTKREIFAMAAMQGVLSAETQDYEYKNRESLIDACVEYADLLLKKLEN